MEFKQKGNKVYLIGKDFVIAAMLKRTAPEDIAAVRTLLERKAAELPIPTP